MKEEIKIIEEVISSIKEIEKKLERLEEIISEKDKQNIEITFSDNEKEILNEFNNTLNNHYENLDYYTDIFGNFEEDIDDQQNKSFSFVQFLIFTFVILIFSLIFSFIKN